MITYSEFHHDIIPKVVCSYLKDYEIFTMSKCSKLFLEIAEKAAEIKINEYKKNHSSRVSMILNNENIILKRSFSIFEKMMQMNINEISFVLKNLNIQSVIVRRNIILDFSEYQSEINNEFESNQSGSLVDMFNIATEDFESIIYELPEKFCRCEYSTISFQGKIWFIGGCAGNTYKFDYDDYIQHTSEISVIVFDPKTQTYTEYPAMNRFRKQCYLTVINGELYAVGGDEINYGNDEIGFSIEKLNTHKWDLIYTNRNSRNDCECFTIGHKIYMMGGLAIRAYHPATNEDDDDDEDEDEDNYPLMTGTFDTFDVKTNMATELIEMPIRFFSVIKTNNYNYSFNKLITF